jgi:ABC-type glycerol-3-phosphate transport system substrate-binding protein
MEVPGNVYRQWLRTQLTGGTAPDIIEFGFFIGGVGDLPARYFDPITSWVEEPNPHNRGTALEGVRWRDTFVDGLDSPEGYIRDLNNYYAITLCVVTIRLFYNEDLLREITGSAEPPASYADFVALGESLAGRRGRRGAPLTLLAGSLFNADIMMDNLYARMGFGVNIERDRFRERGAHHRDFALDFLRGGWDYRRPELAGAFTVLRELALQTRPGFQQLDRDAAMQEFLRGDALMIATGTWDATSLRWLAPFNLGVTTFPFPSPEHPVVGPQMWLPVSEGNVGTSMPFFLNKASRHKEAAIDFLRYATSVEGNQHFVNESGWLPSILEVEVPDYAQVYLPSREGWIGRSGYLRGLGANTTRLWHQEGYRLFNRDGSVESFLTAYDSGIPPALRDDVTMEARNALQNMRRQMPSLVALAALDRLQGVDPARIFAREERESNQHLTEARYYETLAVLEAGAGVTER